MIQLRKSSDRGHANHGWLDTHHTFSFADYFDPAHMGFSHLRVINEDFVEAGKGFGTHPHKDMEIITYVLEGELAHKDSMGNGSIIRPGDVQRMTAGTGVTHSEFNHSKDQRLHLLQIWILPSRKNLEPGYEQKTFPEAERKNQFRLVASQDGRNGSVLVHQNISLSLGSLDARTSISYTLQQNHKAWVHVARGAVQLNQLELRAGDGAALTEEKQLEFRGLENSEVLLFDMN